jgi:hypothetical protein
MVRRLRGGDSASTPYGAFDHCVHLSQNGRTRDSPTSLLRRLENQVGFSAKNLANVLCLVYFIFVAKKLAENFTRIVRALCFVVWRSIGFMCGR